jgi:hypothetical protein
MNTVGVAIHDYFRRGVKQELGMVTTTEIAHLLGEIAVCLLGEVRFAKLYQPHTGLKPAFQLSQKHACAEPVSVANDIKRR